MQIVYIQMLYRIQLYNVHVYKTPVRAGFEYTGLDDSYVPKYETS